jgi:hypothetical protein
MRIRVFSLITFSFAMVASTGFAQNAAPAATPPQVTSTNNPQSASVPLLAVIVPAGNPPEQCITRLQASFAQYRASPNLNSDKAIKKNFDFLSGQLCPLYLVLSSDQYKAASRAARIQLLSLNGQQEANLIALAMKIKSFAQQEGSSSGTGGSTNLTSKGLAAKFLSLASEYGALTQSTSNMTTTVQGTLAGVPLVLLNKNLAEDCSTRLVALVPCFHHDVISVLNRISYSVSFDSSQNGQSLTATASGSATANVQSAAFTGNRHTINAVSGKAVLIAGALDLDKLQKAYQEFEQSPQSAAASSDADFFKKQEAVQRDREFSEWQDKLAKQLEKRIEEKADDRQLIDIWERSGTSLVEALGVPSTISSNDAAQNDLILRAVHFAMDYSAYIAREEETALGLAKPPVLTFEYDENRPAGQPTNSVFRAIYQHKFNFATITANGAFSIYDSDPSSSIPGASRLRDIQAAAQADHDFQLDSAITGKIGVTLTGAYYFQHQSSPAILNVDPSSPVPGVTFTGLPPNATQVFAEKGNISIGQVKLSVGSGSNIKVPISVTYSNRTELITKPTWRGQIGISYDFDSLFASAK